MSGFAWDTGIGAALQPDGSTRFRIWAPSVSTLSLEIDGRDPVAVTADAEGFHTTVLSCPAGAHYRYRLPDGLAVPDPASRRQDGDVSGASVVLDARSYRWTNTDWQGRPWSEAVIYEVHPGAAGGFDGIRRDLARLRDLGVTVVELMPIADFPGAHNWGYDGVLPYAPDEAYGTPDALKALIDAAHGLGLMVFLDVVYNHFGPDGNYLHALAKPFFRDDLQNPWGAAIDFRQRPVRDYFIQNALCWLMEYRFDGLRFDAVHAISEPDFLQEMAATIHRTVEPGRQVHLVLEHEGNAASLLRGSFDAQWTDDVHHCLHVMLTGESEGYYEDFQDPAKLLARCMADGFAYQGETSPHSGKPRGEPSADLPTTAFVICLQNHDQIGNRAFGERLTQLADPVALRAATALLLLSPFIPLIFMGEEIGAREPFLFFTSHNEELAKLVREGRRAEFKHFAAFADPATRARIPDPNAESSFEASIPHAGDAASFATMKALLALRAKHVVPGIPGCRSEAAAPLGGSGVQASWRLGDGRRLTLAMNLARTPQPVSGCTGDVLFESAEGAAASAHQGWLPPRSTVAFLQAGT